MHFPSWETPEDALEYDAVRLFLQSARYVRPNYELQASDLDYLARICRLTGGMPLGIVLAAGWLDVLTLGQIADEIQGGIDILETELRDMPERQRSIRATFNYSWEHLTDAEREVLMKLSVFRGGFTAEAAQAIAGTSRNILRKLVDKALVQAMPTGRYDLHELLRQYGSEKLSQTGQFEAVTQAHMIWFSASMRQREADIKGRLQLEALTEIEADFNNIRVAWSWAAEQHDIDAVDMMLESMYLFCDLHIRYQEGSQLFEQAVFALTRPPDQAPYPIWYRLRSHQAGMWLLSIE